MNPGARWEALGRGFSAFLVVAGIGQLLALGAWAVGDTGVSFGAATGVGWMYFGAFHHVEIRLDAANLDLPGSSTGSLSLSIGVALLAVTAIAVWLLFRAGRSVAERARGSMTARIGHGAAVAIGYAVPAFVLSLLVDVETPFRFGVFASGELRVALAPLQALVFPFAIAGAAGAAGGLVSGLGLPADRGRRLSAAIAGGWRAFVLAIGLSLAGLFVAGVVQPDAAAAFLLPSTARYVEEVFERPATGLVILGHHLVVTPNEAMWTLVPAMGACDVVRASTRQDVLCYSRFPSSVAVAAGSEGATGLPEIEETTFGEAPAGYLLFLLVPAVATLLGGRRAAALRETKGRTGARAGAAAGVVFSALVTVAALLSAVTASFEARVDGDRSDGRLFAGPNPVTGALVAVAWGLVGGAAGGATGAWAIRARPSGRQPAGGGSAPR